MPACHRLVVASLLAPLALSMLAAATAQGTGSTPAGETRPDTTPARGADRTDDGTRWMDRIPREDRAALDVLIGYAAPEFSDDVDWVNGESASLESMRGKVVVIQSFTVRAARTAPQRLVAAFGEQREQGLVLLALHTPDGADRARPAIERGEIDMPVVIDPSGDTSDRFGIFRRPVNIVIDRVGNVRFAGLTDQGLRSAVEMLLAERPEPGTKPRERSEPTSSEVRFPTFATPVTNARDLRGQASPPFHVANWIKDGGEPAGRLTIVDFWATWCGPCLRAIPHMNEIAQHYGDRVFIVGISDESRGAFDRGMIQRNLRLNGFDYSLALDPERRMMQAFAVRSIPNLAVISGDGIVRWQGHPNGLTREVLDPLVEANERLRQQASPNAETTPPARWRQARG